MSLGHKVKVGGRPYSPHRHRVGACVCGVCVAEGALTCASRRSTTCMWPLVLFAMFNAVLPLCDEEGKGGGGRAAEESGGPGRRAERRGAAPLCLYLCLWGSLQTQHEPYPRPLCHYTTLPPPTTPPSSSLCTTAHLVLYAPVGPFLEQQLDGGILVFGSRRVQRRPPVHLPTRRGASAGHIASTRSLSMTPPSQSRRSTHGCAPRSGR